MSVQRTLCVVLLGLTSACGPTAGDEAEGTSDAGGSSTTAEPIPPAEWMSGVYSDRKLDRRTSESTEDGTVDYYEFFADGTFVGNLDTHGDNVRTWEPISVTQARIYPNATDYPSIRWWDAVEESTSDGCKWIATTRVAATQASGPGLFRGKVCAVHNTPCGPDDEVYEGAYCTIYHLEWCDEPPPGCDENGCECDGPPD